MDFALKPDVLLSYMMTSYMAISFKKKCGLYTYVALLNHVRIVGTQSQKNFTF